MATTSRISRGQRQAPGPQRRVGPDGSRAQRRALPVGARPERLFKAVADLRQRGDISRPTSGSSCGRAATKASTERCYDSIISTTSCRRAGTLPCAGSARDAGRGRFAGVPGDQLQSPDSGQDLRVPASRTTDFAMTDPAGIPAEARARRNRYDRGPDSGSRRPGLREFPARLRHGTRTPQGLRDRTLLETTSDRGAGRRSSRHP